jgi:copper ion binding protein
MSTTTFLVPGMTCGHCKQAVTTELTKITGVMSVDVDLDTKQVVVASESPVEWKAIVDAVDEAGFEAVNG